MLSTFKRYEMKFLLDKDKANRLLPEIVRYMTPDAYCQNGSFYSIYNIYYDTADNALIRSSLKKPYHKEKLRLRSYQSPTPANGKVYLEIKEKTGGIVHKRRAGMTLQEARAFIESGSRPATSGYMDNQVIDELSFFLSRNAVQPAAYISYNRMAFFGKQSKDFRLTFDCGITTRRDNLSLDSDNHGNKLLLPDQCLMEVKITDSVPLWLCRALSDLQIYRTSFSKYGREYADYRAEQLSEPVIHPVFTPQPVRTQFVSKGADLIV